jgi:NAD dependent epimerase/dehydratase family enzyme
MMMGEMGDLVLYGQRVVPKRLQESGYEFIYPEISQALNCLRK